MRQVVMARHGHSRAPLITCGDIFRIIIALFHFPSGRLHSGGIDAALLDQPGDLSLCCGWAWIPGLVRHVARRRDSRLVCNPDPQVKAGLAVSR